MHPQVAKHVHTHKVLRMLFWCFSVLPSYASGLPLVHTQIHAHGPKLLALDHPCPQHSGILKKTFANFGFLCAAIVLQHIRGACRNFRLKSLTTVSMIFGSSRALVMHWADFCI